MAARLPATRAFARTATTPAARQCRTFTSTTRMLQEAAPLPAKKPVGAFRGGLFGFLLGSTAAGSGMYYYVVQEYKVANGLLTEDIYSLQSNVQRIEGYVRGLEEKVQKK